MPHGARGTIVPRAAVWAGIAIGAVSLVVLVPNRHELFKRLMADGDAAAAVGLLPGEGTEETAGATVILTAELIRVCEDESWSGKSLPVLIDFLRGHRDFASAAGEVRRQADQIPRGPRTRLWSVLVERAIAEGRLEFAERVEEELLENAEELTADLARQAVTIFRFSNRPQRALEVIERLRGQGGRPLPADLGDLRITLARETSQPEVAYALLKERIAVTDEDAVLRRLLPAAITVGTEAGELEALVPLYEKLISVTEAMGQARGRPDPDLPELKMKFARVCEWTDRPSRAFDIFLPFAAAGNREALDRCIALNVGLFREEELTDALADGYPHYRHDDEITRLTARLLANGARRDEAMSVYGDYLERHPGDAGAWFEMGAVLDECGRHEEALAHFQRAYELDAKDVANLKHLAASAASLGNSELTREALRALAELTRDPEYLVELCMVAASVGDVDCLKDSLRQLLEVGGRQRVKYHIHLAAIYREEGNLEECAKVLAKGLERFPNNVFLKTEVANAYVALKRPEPALRALRGVSLTAHPHLAPVALAALQQLHGAAGATAVSSYLRRFGRELESRDLTSEQLLVLAELNHHCARFDRSRVLFRRVLGVSENPGELARACFHLGQVDSARRHQLKHLASVPQAQSRDYSFLGDIYTKLGERSKATTAYRNALSRLRKSSPSP
ncbi:MAG: tetratricopeptide repeat protein [Akkermansiaceae bacterium]|nr:tetratricopeptide repeat protein [Akkermansiaceae bacterium]